MVKGQKYEQLYWEKAANRIASGISGQLSWYGWRAEVLEKRLVEYMHNEMKKFSKVLEIGSGPIGIVSFLKWGDRYAIDPLEKFYVKNPILTKLRDPEVRYMNGTGESIPFNDAFFFISDYR